jgi:hypothetical protein
MLTNLDEVNAELEKFRNMSLEERGQYVATFIGNLTQFSTEYPEEVRKRLNERNLSKYIAKFMKGGTHAPPDES